jgi:hypothetical protein
MIERGTEKEGGGERNAVGTWRSRLSGLVWKIDVWREEMKEGRERGELREEVENRQR